MKKNYKKTLIACYIGFITQAISINFLPLLFITFNNTYGISLKELSLIPFVFFFTQFIVDSFASIFSDKIGYRKCIVVSQTLSGIGIALLAILPELFSNPIVGILIAVIIYAIGSGLIEVLGSPIIEACPFENKAGVMSILHSFYCWGTMGVILGSTLFFYIFGIQNWKILALIWAALPLLNIYNFATCPIERIDNNEKSMGIKNLLKTPIFWLMIVLMVCSGASEIAISQWASAFVESSLGVSKAIGDLVGPCLFAFFMGISRFLYGKFSEKMDLTISMLICGLMCVGCYLLVSLSSIPILGLIGCATCGFAVGIMWPGSLSISSKKCPNGGTALFAFLALAGDIGGMLSPTIVGNVSSLVGDNLKIGLLVVIVFPIILVITLLVLQLKKKKALKEIVEPENLNEERT